MSIAWAEIRMLARGPTEATVVLTVSMSFSFNAAVVDALKEYIPWHDRAYDEASHTWYATPEYLDLLKGLARRFDSAMLIDGNSYLNLHTGHTFEQLEMF